MKKILILTIIIIFSSCSIFKRVDKHSEKSKHIEKNQTSLNESLKESNVELTNTLESSKEKQNWELDNKTIIEADKITFDKQGNMTAEGNAKVSSSNAAKGDIDKSGERVSSGLKINDTEIQYKEDSQESISSLESVNESTSKPSGKAILLLFVGVMALAIGVMWYLGIRPK